jgi:hypothetical protein
MEGLWTIEFGSSEGVYGGGVVVFADGKLMGGDSGYYYSGSYEVSDENLFTATLRVKPFIEDYPSVFNTLRKDFTLNLSGRIKDADHAIAQGNPEEMPQMDLGVVLTRRETVVAA